MGILMIADAMSSKLVSEQTARVQEFHDRVGILCAEGRCATRLRYAPTGWRELRRGVTKILTQGNGRFIGSTTDAGEDLL